YADKLLRGQVSRLDRDCRPDRSARCGQLKWLARTQNPSVLRGGIGAGARQLGSSDLERVSRICELGAQVRGQPVHRFDEWLEAPRPGSGQGIVARREPEMCFAGPRARGADEPGVA